tara:strand:+ start:496 stop:1458 length:963 start_codon:yes stop_codon:yes gene_type:complete
MSLRSQPLVVVAISATVVLALAQTVMAQGGGRIVGEVVDEYGEPMENVTITVDATDPELRPPQFVTTTGSDGKYALLGFESGIWHFKAEFDGYHGQEGPAPVTQSENPPVNFELTRIRHPLEIALGDEALEGLDPVAIGTTLTQSDTEFNNGNWLVAIDGYQSVLSDLPQLSDLNVQIGQSYHQLEDWDSAIASFEAALVTDPDNEDAKAGIARARMGSGDLSAASSLRETASGLNASREDLYNLGEIEFAQNNIETAAEWYEKASVADPNWEKPFFKLALVELNKGNMAGAKEHFQKVIDIAPDSEEGTQAQATLSALP